MTQRALIGESQTAAVSRMNIRCPQTTVASMGAPKADTVVLTNMPGNWKLVQPLTLLYERDVDGTHLVSDNLFAVYGIGDTFGEAFQDYIASLIDYYQVIAGSIADDTSKQQFARLRQYLQPHS